MYQQHIRIKQPDITGIPPSSNTTTSKDATGKGDNWSRWRRWHQEEFDFSEVQEEAREEAPKDKEWITKERKDRVQRTHAGEKTKARLTKDKNETLS
jgi:hypothetical protein